MRVLISIKINLLVLLSRIFLFLSAQEKKFIIGELRDRKVITYLPRKKVKIKFGELLFVILALLVVNIVLIFQLKETVKKQSDVMSVKINTLTKAVGEMKTTVKALTLVEVDTQNRDKQVFLELSRLCKIFESLLTVEKEEVIE